MKTQKWLGLFTVLTAAFAAESSYGAVTVLINGSTNNGSFEGLTPGTLSNSASTGNWFASGGSGTASISNANPPGAASGTQFGDVTVGFGNEEISNTPVSFIPIPYGSTNLLLSFDAIQIRGTDNGGDPLNWFYYIGARLNPGLPFDLQPDTTFSPTSSWSHFSFYIPYNPPAGIPQFNYIELQIGGNADNHTGSSELGIDNVVFELVPEPATLGILAFGSMGLMLKRRR